MLRPEREEELFELDPDERLLLPEERAPEERLLLPEERAPEERLLLPEERAPEERLLLPVDLLVDVRRVELLDFPALDGLVPTLVVERLGTARLPVLEPALRAVLLLGRVVRVDRVTDRVAGDDVLVALVREAPVVTRLVREPESLSTLRERRSSDVLEAPFAPPVLTIERVPNVSVDELIAPLEPTRASALRPPRVSPPRLVRALLAMVDPRGVLFVPRATDTAPVEPPYHA
ncbi:MAG: hypothetical protein O3A57_07250 [Bacteroidetes bacterium]|nr:hypothetical protein [Bacteroidota bacterium]